MIVIRAAAQDDGWKTEIDNNLGRVSRRLIAPHRAVSAAGTPPALLAFLTEQPDHPGIAHYALHMPSHIFTRLGLWQDSIDSNLASAVAAKNHVAMTLPGAASQDQLHAMDYLAYAYLQTCRDGEAKRVMDEAAAVSKVDQQVFQVAYALAAIPARYVLERKRWSAAAALPEPAPWFPWSRFRYAEAITWFARALGEARGGNPAAARADITRLAGVQRALIQVKEDYDWHTQVEVQRMAGLAWIAHAEGTNDAALRWMRSAADLEDRTDKHPVTPGPVLPARELLAELLMELDQPAKAVPEFETVLRSSPRRFNATYGAARAAELSGDRKRASERYSELLQICGQAASQRLEIQHARAFLQGPR